MKIIFNILWCVCLFCGDCFGQDLIQKQILTNNKVVLQITNWNDHIDRQQRNQIKTIDDKILEAFCDNNPSKLILLYSDTLKKISGATAGDLVKSAHADIKSKTYSVFDEYITTSSLTNCYASIFKSFKADNDYKVSFKVLNQQSYVSLMVYKAAYRDLLITCIYGKYGNEWKLNILHIGEFKLFRKDAISYYNVAKRKFEEGNMIDAVNYAYIARKTARPSEDVFEYFLYPELKTLSGKINSVIDKQFPLPMVLKQIKTLPQVIGEQPTINQDGVFPTVSYKSKINLNDTNALEIENTEIKKIIKLVLPGINRDNKRIYFRAFNKLPTGTSQGESREFILNLP